jgi:hypothetical protein
MTDESASPKRVVPEIISKELESWNRSARILTCAHYSLGVLGIISSAITAGMQPGLASAICTAVSVGCTTILTSLKVEKLARSRRKAASKLQLACIEYQMNLKKTDLDLVKAYKGALLIKSSGDT